MAWSRYKAHWSHSADSNSKKSYNTPHKAIYTHCVSCHPSTWQVKGFRKSCRYGVLMIQYWDYIPPLKATLVAMYADTVLVWAWNGEVANRVVGGLAGPDHGRI